MNVEHGGHKYEFISCIFFAAYLIYRKHASSHPLRECVQYVPMFAFPISTFSTKPKNTSVNLKYPSVPLLCHGVSHSKSINESSFLNKLEPKMKNPIVRLNPPTLPNAGEMGYSQISIVEPGRMAYISGQVAWQPDGQAVPESLVEQMKIVAANAKAALDAVGATPHDVVIARVYVVNLTQERLEEVMPPFIATFEGAQPCVTGIGVAALAGPDLQVEMELVVRLPN